MEIGERGGEGEAVDEAEGGGDVGFAAGEERTQGVDGGEENGNGDENFDGLLGQAEPAEGAGEERDGMTEGEGGDDFQE